MLITLQQLKTSLRAMKEYINKIVPVKVSDLENDSGYLTSYTETDPTVPEWAKAAEKPTYTAAEVGALAADTKIPAKVSDLVDDSGHYTKPSGGIPASDMANGVIPSVDNTLTIIGAAADAKKTGDELSSLKEDFDDLDDRVTALEQGGSGSGLTEDIKAAMLQIARKVAYIDENGQDYYDDLYDSLYPPADLVSISAVYTQSGTVYDSDSLDSLKADLVVTAHMSDQTTRTVTDYTLSGTLAEGTSTVTVTYGGKTTTFNVTVTAKGKSDMDGWTDGVAYTDLTIVQNEYCQALTGNFASYNGWDRTGYVPCNGASTITFPPMPQTDSNSPNSNRFFKEDKTVYGGRQDMITLSKTESTTITVPSEAYYFVISSESAALASCISTGIVPHE